jgi:type I restriction enzyme, S subunit
MKNGWNTLRLEEVCKEITDGSHFSPKTTAAGYPYVTVRDIENDQIDFANCKFISATDYQQLLKNGCRPHQGNVLFSKDGTVGKVALIDYDKDFVVLSSLAIVRPDSERIRPAFLKWMMKSPAFLDEAVGKKTGVAIRRIILRNLKSIPVPVPPLSEQQRIVGVLDEAFEGIATAKANVEKNLQNARALFESYLQSVFTQRGNGWKQKTLEEIATTFGRGKSKHRPRNAPHLYGGRYPFVQTGDIRNADHFITEHSQTYSEAGLAQSKLWPKGTICITIAANIAETAILGFEACFPDSVIGVVANPKEADVGFIEYLLQSFKARIQAMGKGSAQANINMGTFENERFPFPSVVKQKQIVSTLDQLREQIQRLAILYERKLAALEALKKSLLHRAFTGELTREWQESKIVSFPVAIPNITTTDLHAGILAMAYRLHEAHGKQVDFTHVKAEKIAHMIEAFAGIELGRCPVKDAAGPNDFRHLKGVEHRAKMADYFLFQRVEGAAYRVTKYRKFDELVARTEEALGDRRKEVNRLLDVMLPMDWRQAEIFATVYAAWNNLLLEGKEITDEKIALEAREHWHPDKIKIQREKFFRAIEWIKAKGFVPIGRGKKVAAKTG